MKPITDPEPVLTGDGSSTLFVRELDEHYHSSRGAVNESRHVFIDAGFRFLLSKGKRRINLLEMGWGTGLNGLLTVIESQTFKSSVHYTALEAYPLRSETIGRLNYPSLLENRQHSAELFRRLHNAEWKREVEIVPGFTLEKLACRLEEFSPRIKYDLVYYDAFSPRSQPELWTYAVFSSLFSCMTTGAILVTYCAKGAVKRDLKEAGFLVETLPGPPGKREMTRALRP
jgi:tRNA U34 5-methylaminomethyl-2-thiouridine-forming methyltransferase MnmC